ncbi:FadR/GntR family transcriptional regulator [Alkaliphilus peptidifermentans]|uniref:Transcriptional regulator, GntR family n=1 Tax=Alkaliphilus peptidifermentans DSM 18978 TaxID=1120976 RepID=A0A1G5KJC5_9FIRM|nr:FadR/GntR family transcriptional regulator [Alkaliphilus peptidifermentans]SCZ00733.1 transcriptional regulator, GntR family [Alkaliphilus peptidifermentans DSM 18978]
MFVPVKSTKVYEHVIKQIQNMIANGELKRGDKLPSERQLAEQLMVSRTSVREALRALQIIGLIEVRQGDGNFIKDSFDKCLFEPLSVIFMLNESRPEEIVDLRRIIEMETAALAAKRITDDEIIILGNLIKQLKEYGDLDDEKNSVKVDKEFHYMIAQAAKNYLLMSILNVISALMDDFIEDARGIILINQKNKAVLLEQHENIFKAIANRDPKAASEAMNEHINLIIHEYLGKI